MNQSAPSGPTVMSRGRLIFERAVKIVSLPSVVIRPIELVPLLANHSASSGPGVIPIGQPDAACRVKLVTSPSVVMRPIVSLP